MHVRRIADVAAVAAGRGVVAFVAGLAFWAAAPAVVGWQPTSVMTASMSPAIEVGDVVVARPVAADQVLPGRVLLADDPDRPGRLRLHRLQEVASDGTLRTKGDANPSPDSSPLHPDAVRGIGVLRVPWIGLPVVWARTGELAPLALTVLILGASAMLATRRGYDDETDGDGSSGDASSSPAPAPTTRRERRALGLATVTAVVVATTATPAWAALSDDSSASATFAAARVAPPFALVCRSGESVVSWRYDGLAARSFQIIVDGVVTTSGISPDSRSARLPTTRSYWPFERSTVQIRAVVSDRWTADSSETVRIGGGFLGFGTPVCR